MESIKTATPSKTKRQPMMIDLKEVYGISDFELGEKNLKKEESLKREENLKRDQEGWREKRQGVLVLMISDAVIPVNRVAYNQKGLRYHAATQS